MNIFVAFVMIIITIYATITLAKKGVSGVWREIRKGWDEGMAKQHAYKESSVKKSANVGMQVVALTIGTCDSCGTKFVGTTADESSDELQRVVFLGETKVVCKECLAKMLKVYESEEKSSVVKSSAGVSDIIDLVTKSKK